MARAAERTLESPAWLDACHVQKILRDAENDESIEVSDITVKAATFKGDNYGSDMHRIAVEFSRIKDGHRVQQKQSLIAKVVPPGEMREAMMDATGFFATELSMMSVTLPLMCKVLENSCPMVLGARCVYVQYEKPTHVIMEDLTPNGYRMVERQSGMDLEHCLLAVRNLGIFHAASIALKEKDPTLVTKYNKSVMRKDQLPMLQQFINLAGKALATEAATWSELSPRIMEKLSKLADVLFDKACDANVVRQDDFNVLNHGDYWVNNMLFRYDEQQKPIEHIFVDFQISNYGSPAIDILYFLGTSPTNEVRLHHREVVLREYHTSLSSTMVKLKCNTEAPSFDKLQEILKERAFGEVVANISVLPLVVLEKGDEIEFNDEDFKEIIENDKQYENPGYRGKTYRKIMTELLPLYDSSGLLDV